VINPLVQLSIVRGGLSERAAAKRPTSLQFLLVLSSVLSAVGFPLRYQIVNSKHWLPLATALWTTALLLAGSQPAFADRPWAATEIDQTPMSSRPSAVQYSSGPNNTWNIVFFEGPIQALYVYLWLSPAKAVPNIATTCGPSAVLANETLAVFYCGKNGHIWVASERLNFDTPTFDKFNIVDTGIANITSDPSAATTDGKSIDVVYRGSNGHLWQLHVSDVQHKKWSKPEDLNAPLPSSPSLAAQPLDTTYTTNGLQVLYRGDNGHLWRAYWPTDIKNKLWWSGGIDTGGDVLGSDPTSDVVIGTAFYLLPPPPLPSGLATVPAISDRFFSTDSIHIRNGVWPLNGGALQPAQSVAVSNANFSLLLGNAISTTLYYRNSAGHLGVVEYPQGYTVPNCGEPPNTCTSPKGCSCP
jgi:hypothetical protein